ncbi:MAG: GNAT family N-acetyltransferase, partial [Verrucomicrobiaceae bacterium]
MNIQKLLPQQRALYENHLKRLNWNDRMMRFESSVSDEYIESYVRTIPQDDAIFAILD